MDEYSFRADQRVVWTPWIPETFLQHALRNRLLTHIGPFKIDDGAYRSRGDCIRRAVARLPHQAEGEMVIRNKGKFVLRIRKRRLKLLDTIVALGRTWLGEPYVFGEEPPGDTDCSGLTKRVVFDATNGRVDLPHSSSQQATVNSLRTVTDSDQMYPGMLAFFNLSPRPGVDHVSILTKTDGALLTWMQIEASTRMDAVVEREMSYEANGLVVVRSVI